MNKQLRDIIKKSTFVIAEGRYIYAKVASAPVTSHHFLVSRDNDEITVVTKVEHIGDLDVIKKTKMYMHLLHSMFQSHFIPWDFWQR